MSIMHKYIYIYSHIDVYIDVYIPIIDIHTHVPTCAQNIHIYISTIPKARGQAQARLGAVRPQHLLAALPRRPQLREARLWGPRYQLSRILMWYIYIYTRWYVLYGIIIKDPYLEARGTYNWLHNCSCNPLTRPRSRVGQVMVGL